MTYRKMTTSLLLSALLCVVAPIAAQPGQMPISPPTAKDYIEAVVNEIVTEVKSDRVKYDDYKKIILLIDERVMPSVDSERFSKIAFGKYWQKLSIGDQQRMVKALQDTFARSYGKSLVLLADVEKVTFSIPKGQKSKSYRIVESLFVFRGGEAPISVSYVMMPYGSRWKIFDLVIDGLSVVKQFRNNFQSEISEKGLDALVKRLADSSHSS